MFHIFTWIHAAAAMLYICGKQQDLIDVMLRTKHDDTGCSKKQQQTSREKKTEEPEMKMLFIIIAAAVLLLRTHLTLADVHASHVVRSTGSSSSPDLRLRRRLFGWGGGGCISVISGSPLWLRDGESYILLYRSIAAVCKCGRRRVSRAASCASWRGTG